MKVCYLFCRIVKWCKNKKTTSSIISGAIGVKRWEALKKQERTFWTVRGWLLALQRPTTQMWPIWGRSRPNNGLALTSVAAFLWLGQISSRIKGVKVKTQEDPQPGIVDCGVGATHLQNLALTMPILSKVNKRLYRKVREEIKKRPNRLLPLQQPHLHHQQGVQ